MVAQQEELLAGPRSVARPVRPPRRGRWALSRGTLRTAVALAGISGVAAVVRLWQIDAVGFNSDEAVYAGQGASIAGDPTLSQFFPIFRAHPLLFQTLVSLTFLGGDGSEIAPRLIAVLFGLATVVVTFLLGVELYGKRVGLIASLFVALMPYHVVVSRQVLLDAPMVLFATLVLYCVARYCRQRAPGWLYAAAVAMGLAFLTKETAIVLLGGLVVFSILTPNIRVRPRHLLVAGGILLALIAIYPLSLQLSGRSQTGQNYLFWQLFRPPNHPVLFYLQTVPPVIGFGVVGLALVGLYLLRRSGTWREWLLCCWAAVPVVFFTLWPTKGFQYLLPVVPVAAVLAARTLVATPLPIRLMVRGPALADGLRLAAVLAVVVSLAVPTWQRIDPVPTATFLAGSGGLPAARETGHWIDANLPLGSRALAIGPSMANLVQYYGHRKAFGLSVSPNPMSRNPSYEPVDNPDRQLRTGALQYVVWDAYSAERTPFFSRSLLGYVDKYRGVAIHTETVDVVGAAGESVPKPVIIVYELRP
jgi:4-amino-4-deoxy-L-arabinose transferase-like glycosyltransferase